MSDTAAAAPKPSAVELAKLASNYLEGDIPKELVHGVVKGELKDFMRRVHEG
jgi:hypothetical protein